MTPLPAGPCRFAHDDGAYVLGALSPDERVAFERHLADCPECARSVRQLAGLPGLLARIPVETVDAERQPAPVPVPDTLLPGLVRRARSRRRRRTVLVTAFAAAAAAVAVGTGVAIGQQFGDGAGEQGPAAVETAPAVPMEPVGEVPIKATVALTSVGWGTRLDFTCEYTVGDDDEGGRGGRPAYRDESQPSYAMYVRTTSGSIEQVASWRALPHRVLHIMGATAAERDDITEVEVRASDGRTVLRRRT